MNDTQVINLLRRIAMDQAYIMDELDMLIDDTGSAFGGEYTKWKTKRRAYIEELKAQAEEENNDWTREGSPTN